MSVMSLEELKRANASGAETEKPESEQEEVEEVEQEQSESEEAEAETGTGAEPDEAWKATDDKPSKERKFSDSDIGAAKQKLRAKLEKRHQAETEALRVENERLKQQLNGGAVAPAALPPRPTEAQYGYDPDKYAQALAEWEDKRIEHRISASQQKAQVQQRMTEAQRQLSQAEDEHYERAAKLVSQHSIAPEAYKAADEKVRDTLERLRPGEGELIAAQLINVIGEGSEKLFYWLGKNPEALSKLESELIRDPSGVKAVAYLSRKAAEFTLPAKRTTSAPTPPTEVNGDGSKLPASAKSLQTAYKAAHKEGNNQKAFDLKRKARAAGVDTSTW